MRRPVPFRTRKLSRPAPMVLRGKPVGEQGAADRWTAFRGGPRRHAACGALRRSRARRALSRGGPRSPRPIHTDNVTVSVRRRARWLPLLVCLALSSMSRVDRLTVLHDVIGYLVIRELHSASMRTRDPLRMHISFGLGLPVAIVPRVFLWRFVGTRCIGTRCASTLSEDLMHPGPVTR